MLLAFPAAVLMAFLAPPLMTAFFGSDEAAGLLVIMAVGSPFMHLDLVMTSALQGLGRPGVALGNFFVGEVVGLAGILAATARPGWGIAGVALATVISTAIEATMDYLAVARTVGALPSLKVLRAPVLAAGIAYFLVQHFFPWLASAIGNVAAAVVLTAVVVVGVGTYGWRRLMV